MSLSKRCMCEDPRLCLHPYWYRFMFNGKLRRASTDTAKLRVAERVETKAKNDAMESKHKVAKVKVVLLSDHINAYIAHTTGRNRTAYKNRGVLDRFLCVAGNRPLDQIANTDIERWMTSRCEGDDAVKQSTVNRELIIIRGCFTKAVEWKLLSVSPAKVKGYRVDDNRIRTLDTAELQIVLSIPDPFVVLVCRATIESLARISELLTLKREHIGPSWVEMRKKGGRVSRVAVTDALRTALLARCHASGYVFGERSHGRPPSQSVASTRVGRALTNAGVLDASHHTMRHTGVTLMLEHGVNPRVIQKLAGWSSLSMLERYGHARDAEAIRAVHAVSDHLAQIGEGNQEVVTKPVTEVAESVETGGIL